MDYCSFFINNKALFGSFPTQESVNELERVGVRLFVNLTIPFEKRTQPYRTQYATLHYPIRDRSVPTNWLSFAQFILTVVQSIEALPPDKYVYIHCKGGHGRAGIVVACILCVALGFDPITALAHTNEMHNKRPVMRDKWRLIGSPQTYNQKKFVCQFCSPLVFSRSVRNGCTWGFANSSPHSVTTSLGSFQTSEAAIQAAKAPADVEVVGRLKKCKTAALARRIGNSILPTPSWRATIYGILWSKMDQHPEIAKRLLRTGLRPIVHQSRFDPENLLGKMLVQLRNDMYRALSEGTWSPRMRLDLVSIGR